jgi:hypothetical protein
MLTRRRASREGCARPGRMRRSAPVKLHTDVTSSSPHQQPCDGTSTTRHPRETGHVDRCIMATPLCARGAAAVHGETCDCRVSARLDEAAPAPSPPSSNAAKITRSSCPTRTSTPSGHQSTRRTLLSSPLLFPCTASDLPQLPLWQLRPRDDNMGAHACLLDRPHSGRAAWRHVRSQRRQSGNQLGPGT